MVRLHTGGDDPSFNRGHGGTDHPVLLETLRDDLKQEGRLVTR